MNEDELSNLAIAAMLHDIGKFQIPKKILHKTTKLTPEEYKLVQTHARKGYEELQKYHEISSVVRNAVLNHHENIDGTGYNKVVGDKQTIYSRILHIADVYDALTSVRKFREAFSPQEAVEYIMGNSGKMFDKNLVDVFINKFAIYPVGLTVRLSNGERAVVVTNEHNSLRPIIRLFSDELNNPLIDLSDNKDYFNVTIVGLD